MKIRQFTDNIASIFRSVARKREVFPVIEIHEESEAVTVSLADNNIKLSTLISER